MNDSTLMAPHSQLLQRSMQTLLFGQTALSVGVDLLDARRIDAIVTRHADRFVRRLLCEREIAFWQEKQGSVRHLAKQFAAKEAIAKALGTGIAQGLTFQQLQVYRDGLGAPYVELVGAAAHRIKSLGGRGVRLSLSDEGHWVVAIALVV